MGEYHGMSSVLEVKMIDEGDDLRIVVPRSYFQRLGLERGETLLVTVEEERSRAKRKHAKARVRRVHKHN
jgi:bifunctional DNA-binding transcriptional regulator/antitoxin component of YhaV-PrlF toxin-antitoxin module